MKILRRGLQLRARTNCGTRWTTLNPLLLRYFKWWTSGSPHPNKGGDGCNRFQSVRVSWAVWVSSTLWGVVSVGQTSNLWGIPGPRCFIVVSFISHPIDLALLISLFERRCALSPHYLAVSRLWSCLEHHGSMIQSAEGYASICTAPVTFLKKFHYERLLPFCIAIT